jgi:hypothetical protein
MNIAVGAQNVNCDRRSRRVRCWKPIRGARASLWAHLPLLSAIVLPAGRAVPMLRRPALALKVYYKDGFVPGADSDDDALVRIRGLGRAARTSSWWMMNPMSSAPQPNHHTLIRQSSIIRQTRLSRRRMNGTLIWFANRTVLGPRDPMGSIWKSRPRRGRVNSETRSAVIHRRDDGGGISASGWMAERAQPHGAAPSLLARTHSQRPWHDRKVPQPHWIGITAIVTVSIFLLYGIIAGSCCSFTFLALRPCCSALFR